MEYRNSSHFENDKNWESDSKAEQTVETNPIFVQELPQEEPVEVQTI